MNTKENVLELRKENNSYGQIAKKLNIAKTTVRYHCQTMGLDGRNKSKEKLDNKTINEIKFYYKNNTLIDTAKKFNVNKSTVVKYGDTKLLNLTKEQRKERNYASVKKRIIQLKKMAVEYKGGKCIKCEYNKCVWALDFHHRNPEEKEFSIGQHFSRSWDKLKIELDKCDLLCANCHRELHYEENYGGIA